MTHFTGCSGSFTAMPIHTAIQRHSGPSASLKPQLTPRKKTPRIYFSGMDAGNNFKFLNRYYEMLIIILELVQVRLALQFIFLSLATPLQGFILRT